MFKTAQLRLKLKLRWYQDQISDGCECSRLRTLIMTCVRGKGEATLRTMAATPVDMLVIPPHPPFWLRLREIPPRIFSETDYRERGLLWCRILPPSCTEESGSKNRHILFFYPLFLATFK